MADTRMPTLGALRVFEAAARLGSFKRAAEELGVTPAAVSFQVRHLEADLDRKLFARERNAIRLTEAGRTFFPKLTRGLRTVEEAFGDYLRATRTRPFRVTAGPAVMARWLMPRMSGLRTELPEIDVEFVASLSVLDLGAQEIDFAIRFGVPPASGQHARRIAEEQVLPVVAARLAPDVLTLAALDRIELIHDRSLVDIDPKAPDWSAWLQRTGSDTALAERGLTFSQADHAIQAALDGAGIALARLALAHPDLEAGRLVAPFGPGLPTGLHYYLVERPAEPSAKHDAVRQWLETNVVDGLRGAVGSV